MGYRSKVVMYIVEQEDLTIKQMIRGAQNIEEFCQDCFNIGMNSEGKRVLRAEFENVKWYSYAPIVEYWDNILKSLKSEDYVFTRLGEDDDDAEIIGDYGYPCLIREYDYDDIDFELCNHVDNEKTVINCA